MIFVVSAFRMWNTSASQLSLIMLKEARHSIIVDAVNGKKYVSISDLMVLTNSSESTIRADIIELGVPLLKVDGILLAYKGDKGMEELRESERALRLLRTRFSNAQKEELPGGAGMRINLFFKKLVFTPLLTIII